MNLPKTDICECGRLIKGNNEKHLRSNMEFHKKTKEHKEIMRILRKRGKEVKKI